MEVSVGPTPPYHQHEEHSTEHIAQVVAALLAPSITASVEKEHAWMLQFKKKLGEEASRPNEVAQRLSNIEDELYQAQTTEHSQDKTNQYIIQNWWTWRIG